MSGGATRAAGSESQNANWRAAHGPNRPRVEPALGCEPFVAAVGGARACGLTRG